MVASGALDPISPREVQALDPLVQLLVQDIGFISAVRDGALHGAAIAAVRLLKPHLGGTEYKRPADRRVGALEADGYDGPAPRHAATSPAGAASLPLQRQYQPDPRLRELMRCIREEALALEDLIPWNSVRRTWRNKRSNWRRHVKTGELVPDMALRLKELRAALLTEEGAAFSGCGHPWRVQLEACIHGRGSHHSLAGVWEELKTSVKAWLDIRDPKPEAAGAAAAAVQLHAGAVRAAVVAMQGAGGSEGALLQVPLEAILGHSREGLLAVQQAIDLERRALEAQQAPQQQQQQQQQQCDAGGGPAVQQHQQQEAPPLMSYFSSINAGWEESEVFDSGAESEGAGSDATDMDSDWD